MRGIVRENRLRAIGGDDNAVARISSSDKSVVDPDSQWFPDATRVLYEAKAGTALHYETGFDERSCQRYAAGQVKVPGDFLRALLRGQNGYVWLSAIMDGSDAPWWRDVQRALCIMERLRPELRD